MKYFQTYLLRDIECLLPYLSNPIGFLVRGGGNICPPTMAKLAKTATGARVNAYSVQGVSEYLFHICLSIPFLYDEFLFSTAVCPIESPQGTKYATLSNLF